MLQTINKNYLACILFALSLLMFIRTTNYSSVWDDQRVHFSPANQLKMDKDIPAFWKEHSGMYIPLTYTTWAFIKRMSNHRAFNPNYFHLLNVLTHCINGVLLFYILLLLFKNNATAFLGGLLFLIHPVQVESVAWISEFRGLFSSFFGLLSLFFVLNELDSKRPETPYKLLRSGRYWLSFMLYGLSLLAKPSGIVLPLILLILIWRYYDKNLLKTTAKALLLWAIPAAIVVFMLLVKNPENSVPVLQRFFIAGFSLLFYLQKIIAPYPLAACYGYIPIEVVNNPLSYVALPLCIVLLIVLFIKRKSFPDLFAAFSILLICVLPVLGLIPFEYQKHSTVADRYLYLGMIGVALLVSFIHQIFKGIVTRFFIPVVLIVFAILTIKQVNIWKDEFTLWDHTLTYYQNSSTVYYNRGVQYSLKGNFTNAIKDYTEALHLQPDYLNALFNRANAYENTGNAVAAFNDYDAYLKIDPEDGAVYYKLSYLFYKAGKLDDALDNFQKAESLNFPVNKRFKQLLLNKRFKTKETIQM